MSGSDGTMAPEQDPRPNADMGPDKPDKAAGEQSSSESHGGKGVGFQCERCGKDITPHMHFILTDMKQTMCPMCFYKEWTSKR